jgi:hypothetical protein
MNLEMSSIGVKQSSSGFPVLVRHLSGLRVTQDLQPDPVAEASAPPIRTNQMGIVSGQGIMK